MTVEIEKSKLGEYDRIIWFECDCGCGFRQQQNVYVWGVDETIEDWTDDNGDYWMKGHEPEPQQKDLSRWSDE